MDFERPTLAELKIRVWSDLASRLAPVAKTPRYNLLQIVSCVDAGNYHLLHGDLEFLSRQIFPDTAERRYLRAHWSDRVKPKTASQAVGLATFTGTVGVSIPAGLLVAADSGAVYYVTTQVAIGEGGTALAQVQSVEAGEAQNQPFGAILAITSDKPIGLNSQAIVGAGGLAGGVDEESDASYLSRVIAYQKTGSRYGKKGDFAAWAVDSTAEVTKAFEIKNFGPMGALLIQVIGGDQIAGVTQVANLAAVRDYISVFAPPVLFTVQTPSLMPLNPTITLLPTEDTAPNRLVVTQCLQAWLQTYGKPEGSITPEQLRASFVDGSTITGGSVVLPENPFLTTALQYPILGAITWGA